MTGDPAPTPRTADLYQHTILDHNRNPRNRRIIEGGRHAEGDNPLCGDRITVYVLIEGDVLRDVAFQGHGCAICTASASLMTEHARGCSRTAADGLLRHVHALVTAPSGAPVDVTDPLAALSGVRQFPVRVKCALLPWTALEAALHDRAQASTE